MRAPWKGRIVSDFPRNGDTIEVMVGHWPTPTHVLRAADAIDALCHPRYGAILRAVVEGIERGAVEKPASSRPRTSRGSTCSAPPTWRWARPSMHPFPF